jgi:ketosteroid isomerase-like protein
VTTPDVDLVLRCIDAFQSRDVEVLLELVHDDVQVKSLMTEAERPVYSGHDGVREWMAAVVEIFPDWNPTPAELRTLGEDAVLIGIDVVATAATSRVPIDQRFWAAAIIRDGKLSWYGFFRTEEDALDGVASRRLLQN